jgi:hypothetical protein
MGIESNNWLVGTNIFCCSIRQKGWLVDLTNSFGMA